MAQDEPFDPFHEVIDSHSINFEIGDLKLDLPFGMTKFMLLQLVAAAILLALFLPLVRRVSTKGESRGRLWVFAEFILVFVRDQIAKPGIGEHDYKKYLPFLWTLFVFTLSMNLMGMIPFLGSPTADLSVTAPLALVSFILINASGIRANHGFFNYLKTYIPHIEMNDPVLKIIGPFILVLLFCIEILSLFIRGTVLAARLFANMLAGHTALFVILSFIRIIGAASEHSTLMDIAFWPATIVIILLNTALSLLELFVACLQAFVFTFLTSVFIGMATHPDH